MTVFIKATKQFSKMSKRKRYKDNMGGGRCNSTSINDVTPTLRDGVSNGAECLKERMRQRQRDEE